VALALPALIGFAGLAVDTTRFLRAKTIVANAADHAALAAASVDGEDRVAVAERFFNAQVPESYRQAVSIKPGGVKVRSSTGNGPVIVEVDIEAEVQTILGQVVGIHKLGVQHRAQAKREVNNLEVVMGLPASGTMCSNKGRTPNTNRKVPGDTLLELTPDPGCRHFNAMKTGVKAFIDIVKANQATASFKVGLVPYNAKVKFANPTMIPPSVGQSEAQGYYADFNGFEPLGAIQSMTSNTTLLQQALDRMTLTPEAVAWTRTDLPTHTAGLMLDPTQRTYFPGAEEVKPYNTRDIKKVLILMSDGSNIGCCFTNWRPGNFYNQYVYNYKPYNDEQIRICKFLKENNVQIFTILFDVQESDVGGDIINNVFARCASGAYSDATAREDNPSAMLRCKHRQNCYNVATDEQLVAAYKDIAQNFYAPVLRK